MIEQDSQITITLERIGGSAWLKRSEWQQTTLICSLFQLSTDLNRAPAASLEHSLPGRETCFLHSDRVIAFGDRKF